MTFSFDGFVFGVPLRCPLTGSWRKSSLIE